MKCKYILCVKSADIKQPVISDGINDRTRGRITEGMRSAVEWKCSSPKE